MVVRQVWFSFTQIEDDGHMIYDLVMINDDVALCIPRGPSFDWWYSHTPLEAFRTGRPRSCPGHVLGHDLRMQ